MICQVDDSHERPSLIFSEKYIKKYIYSRMSSGKMSNSTLRINKSKYSGNFI